MMFKLQNYLAASMIAIGGLASVPAIAIASEVTAEEAAMRLNLAARQRVLSQQIAMSSCFVTAGVDARFHMERLQSAFADFSSVHNGLLNGDESLGLQKEGYRGIVEALESVDAQWSDYSELVDAFLLIRAMPQSIMVDFDQSGLRVLDEMNIAVTTIASNYSANLDELPQILALTIDFAAREQMLTQKMAKEYCLISAGINIEENTRKLQESYEQFTLILQALKDGMPQMIVPAPTPEILAGLEAVEAEWDKHAHAFEIAIAGELIMPADRHYVSTHIDIVLDRMTEVVELYEGLHGLPNF